MSGLPAQLASLMMPAAYPHPVARVRLIETHISWVLLAGDFTYKIKRPVRYPFIDMRSAEQRHFFCREELRLNRRFAPDLYLDVVAITNEGGGARIGGNGEIVEHAVRMRQFDTREELDRLIIEQRVAPHELAAFGEGLARIHAGFPPLDVSRAYGTFASVRKALLENLQQLERVSQRAGGLHDSEDLVPALRQKLDESADLIDARHAGGRVKECHGDLHCRNVVRNGGALVAFDGLEFEPAFRWIDVAEEIAFLFMDLLRRGGAAHASAFLNGYLRESGDYEAVRLLRLYGAHRAAVRAKVAALEIEPAASPDERERLVAEHRTYVECARDLLQPHRPMLILMSGLSGSGKTWLAQQLAERLGAIHVRSDVERKRLGGLAARDSSRSGIDQALYSRDASERTYRRLAQCASAALSGGYCAVADATFQRRADRALFSRLSGQLGAPLALVRCRAPSEILRARIADRQRKGADPSEATLAVLEHQQASFETIDPGEGLDVIDADTTRESIVAEVETALRGIRR